MNNEELIEIAKQAREKAFAPISNFKVGAAVLTKDNKVYSGCNVEDPSGIGITNICAERCAMVKAVSEGEREFVKIAAVGGAPCGACRQYLNSFNSDMKIVFMENDEIKELSLNELLPYKFDEKF